MKGTYTIQIKGTSVDIEVRVDSGNTLLDLLLTEDYYESIHEQLKTQLEQL